MYLKLALRNTKRSVFDYLIYIASMVMLTSIIFLSNSIADWGDMQAGFQTMALPLLIVMIMAVLVNYINHFIIRQRTKEFATYMLLGMEKDKLSLVFLCELIRRYRAEKPLFAMDFQNDAEYVGGCIASGHRYLHINANGDIDPCVFVHYSDSNIREKTLLEALRSPMMMAYHQRQPFNKNMLRPCPMLENPEKLREMVSCTDAHSTDLQSPESVEHLCSKCDRYASEWKPVADELWEKSPRKDKYK